MEEEKQIVSLIKQTPQILSTVYEDLAQPGVRKVGEALETVFEFSTSILLPIKLLNEKFKLNFQRNLNDYKKKIESIDDDKLCDVNPQIGTPIVEKLSYTTNEEIADLFTTLLSKASSTETVNQAHPSFVQFIERLSVDEARLIKFLKGKDFIPSISFKGTLQNDDGFIELKQNATLLPFEVDFIFPNNVLTYIDNLESMGIIDTKHGNYKNSETLYNPILEKYNYENERKKVVEEGRYKDIKYDKGYLKITELGKSFIEACTI